MIEIPMFFMFHYITAPIVCWLVIDLMLNVPENPLYDEEERAKEMLETALEQIPNDRHREWSDMKNKLEQLTWTVECLKRTEKERTLPLWFHRDVLHRGWLLLFVIIPWWFGGIIMWSLLRLFLGLWDYDFFVFGLK